MISFNERSQKADEVATIMRNKIGFLSKNNSIKYGDNLIEFRFYFNQEDDADCLITEEFIKTILEKMNLEIDSLKIVQIEKFIPVIMGIIFTIKY